MDWGCIKLWERLNEEKFFFFYHLNGLSLGDFWTMPPIERQWHIKRFIQQRNRENEEIEKRSKKK